MCMRWTHITYIVENMQKLIQKVAMLSVQINEVLATITQKIDQPVAVTLLKDANPEENEPFCLEQIENKQQLELLQNTLIDKTERSKLQNQLSFLFQPCEVTENIDLKLLWSNGIFFYSWANMSSSPTRSASRLPHLSNEELENILVQFEDSEDGLDYSDDDDVADPSYILEQNNPYLRQDSDEEPEAINLENQENDILPPISENNTSTTIHPYETPPTVPEPTLRILNAIADSTDIFSCTLNEFTKVAYEATVKQLRLLWVNTKQRQSEALTKERQHRLATGGGPSISDAVVDPDVPMVAPALIVGIDNAIDSDLVEEYSQSQITDAVEIEEHYVLDDVSQTSIISYDQDTEDHIVLPDSPIPSTSQMFQPFITTIPSARKSPARSNTRTGLKNSVIEQKYKDRSYCACKNIFLEMSRSRKMLDMLNEDADRPELSSPISNVPAVSVKKIVNAEVLHEDGGIKEITCDSSIRKDMPDQSAEDIYSDHPSTFSLEVPSSFENSPLIQLEELLDVSHHRSTPVNSELSVPTPMPSPTNVHSICDSSFCPNHVDNCSVMSSSSFSTTNSLATSNSSGRTLTLKTTRKRQRCPEEWTDLKRKCLKNLGKKYVTKKGKAVDEKTMRPSCKCRYKCSDKISHQQRLNCFTKFWQLGDRAKQWNFIIKYSDKMKKKRCLNQDTPNNRKYTYKYYLPLITGSSESHCAKEEVCQTMFINTLAVSTRILKTAWKKYDGSAIVEEDRRGRHDNHKVVLDDAMKKSVCDHLYLEWFDPEKYTSKATTVRQCRDIVNSNFNLAFHIPKKDQCDECHVFRLKNNPTDQEKETFQQHQTNKKTLRAKRLTGTTFEKFMYNTRNSVQTELKPAYSKPIMIPAAKYKDLMDMCRSEVVPLEYHPYFNSLPHHTTVDVSEESDDDLSE
ncbi:hypothetical protein HW555_012099 [Spodoptera exigua]|uniref:Uncharacterized protein n=1 Tax=Spodoptera exigua TaxID=7107 RepID=A0A835G5V9_SPOEX|nr:hypothetical protein HW555_012099 [Spodoptera exigua]